MASAKRPRDAIDNTIDLQFAGPNPITTFQARGIVGVPQAEITDADDDM